MLESKLDCSQNSSEQLSARLELYTRAEKALREFFDGQTFCLDNCISKEYSFYGYIEEGSFRPVMGRYGCCLGNHNIPHVSEPEKNKDIVTLFLIRQNENSSADAGGLCPYHSSEGCQIRKYRSPVCLSYICREFSGYLMREHSIFFEPALVRDRMNDILTGKIDEKQYEDFLSSIRSATRRVRGENSDKLIYVF